MHSIEQQALQKYSENLKYFEANHPQVYKKLITFDHAITNGIYQEKYSLEYRNNEYFDMQEIGTGHFLYNENSDIYSNNITDSVNLNRTGSVFEGQQRFPIQKHELEEIEDFKNFHSSLWATAKIIHYNSVTAPKQSSKMKKLYKFIFLNTGLGIHLEKIVNKFNIDVVFIKEDDLELFRLSLFVTNYANLLKKRTVFFSIMQSFPEMQHTFLSFLNEAFNRNLYIKFLPFSKNYQDDLEKLQSITLSQNHILYPYQAFMARSFSMIDKLSSNKPFLNVSRSYDQSVLTNKPILILAAGPSVQNNIKWIKKNQDKFITIGVLSACRYLFEHDINPDIIVHIDPQEQSTRMIEYTDIKKFINSKIILGSSVHNALIERFQNSRMTFIEDATTFKVGYGFFTLPTIGEYASILPLMLGATNTYLLGLDLALDPETMKDHIDLHISSKKLSASDNDQHSVSFHENVCYVKGNFAETVPSKTNFRSSITQFNHAVNYFKQSHQNIYNLSNGAYLEGTIPLKISDADVKHFATIDKDIFKKEFESFLHENSSSSLRDVDKENLSLLLKKAKSIIDKCNELRKMNTKEESQFLNKKVLPLVQEISEMSSSQKSDLGEIYFEYFKITLSFIFDTFNTQELKNPKKHVQTIDKILLEEIEKIASTYHETISGFLQRNKIDS